MAWEMLRSAWSAPSERGGLRRRDGARLSSRCLLRLPRLRSVVAGRRRPCAYCQRDLRQVRWTPQAGWSGRKDGAGGPVVSLHWMPGAVHATAGRDRSDNATSRLRRVHLIQSAPVWGWPHPSLRYHPGASGPADGSTCGGPRPSGLDELANTRPRPRWSQVGHRPPRIGPDRAVPPHDADTAEAQLRGHMTDGAIPGKTVQRRVRIPPRAPVLRVTRCDLRPIRSRPRVA